MAGRARRLAISVAGASTRPREALFLAGLLTALILLCGTFLSPLQHVAVAFLLVLPVSLLAATFGVVGGLLAAAVAFAAFMISVLLGGERNYLTTYFITPSVLIAISLLLGAHTEREWALKDELSEESERRREAFEEFVAIIAPPRREVEPPWEVLRQYRPAAPLVSRLGGDFLDYEQEPDGTLRFVLGDVVGHGARAAALGAGLRLAWCSLSPGEEDLERLMGHLCEAFLSQGRGDGQLFATACLGRIAPTGEVTLVCAGHDPPFVICSDRVVQAEVEPGLAIGVSLGQESSWPVQALRLGPGEWLVAFTDGLPEAWSEPLGERLGIERLGQAIAQAVRSGEAGLHALVEDVERAHGGPLDDDAAVLAMRRRG
jgi:hypothetical protein